VEVDIELSQIRRAEVHHGVIEVANTVIGGGIQRIRGPLRTHVVGLIPADHVRFPGRGQTNGLGRVVVLQVVPAVHQLEAYREAIGDGLTNTYTEVIIRTVGVNPATAVGPGVDVLGQLSSGGGEELA